jgi:cell division protein ZapE
MNQEAAAPGIAGSSEGPLVAYRRRCAAGMLEADPAQLLAAEKLQSLHNALARTAAQGSGANGRGSWCESLGFAQLALPETQGLYIFGGVGRGKSMLMDIFFAGAHVEKKRRVHFLAFMLEVHEALHAWRKTANGDPIPPLAASIAAASRLFCFDEFQVTNIADAMLLGRLFAALFEEGVVVVATSNTAPDDLYKGGLQRDRFLPFIALLKGKLDILELDGETDYRRLRIRDLALYHTSLGLAATRSLAEAFARLTDGAAPAPTTLLAQGREVALAKAAKGVAWLRFDDLCRQPWGSADYLAIATHFHTVLLDGLPVMTRDDDNAARRFMTLIDALYEHRVHVIAAAENVPDRLFRAGIGAQDFRRAASRLLEMQTPEYLHQPHLP